MSNDDQNRQLVDEAVDWLQVCLGTVLFVAIIVLATALHAAISAGAI